MQARFFLNSTILVGTSVLISAALAHASLPDWSQRMVHNAYRATQVCANLFDAATHRQDLKSFYETPDVFLKHADPSVKTLLLDHLSLTVVQLRSSHSRKASALSHSFLEILGVRPMSDLEHVHFALNWVPQVLASLPADMWRGEKESQPISHAFRDLVTISGLNEHYNRRYPGLAELLPETLDTLGRILSHPVFTKDASSYGAQTLVAEALPLVPAACQMAMGVFQQTPGIEQPFELRFAALRLLPALARVVVNSPSISAEEQKLATDGLLRAARYNLETSFEDFHTLALATAEELGYTLQPPHLADKRMGSRW